MTRLPHNVSRTLVKAYLCWYTNKEVQTNAEPHQKIRISRTLVNIMLQLQLVCIQGIYIVYNLEISVNQWSITLCI